MKNSLTILHKDSDFDIIMVCTGLKVVRA